METACCALAEIGRAVLPLLAPAELAERTRLLEQGMLAEGDALRTLNDLGLVAAAAGPAAGGRAPAREAARTGAQIRLSPCTAPAAPRSVPGTGTERGGVAMDGRADDDAVRALRHGWGEAYEFGWDEKRGYWARRKDGRGGELAAPDPDGLWSRVYADYTRRPVPRARPAGTPGP